MMILGWMMMIVELKKKCMKEFSAVLFHWQAKVFSHQSEQTAHPFGQRWQMELPDSTPWGTPQFLKTECQRRSLTSQGMRKAMFPTTMTLAAAAESFSPSAVLGFIGNYRGFVEYYHFYEFDQGFDEGFTSSLTSPSTRDMRSHLHGCRVGEALHPGPPTLEKKPPRQRLLTNLMITALNPTAILDKEHVIQGIGSDLFFLSETSATSFVQKLMSNKLQRLGYKSVWGTPAKSHRFIPRGEGVEERRGLATGVSLHATVPLQGSQTTTMGEWEAAGRLTRGFAKIGTMELQCIALYGIASSNQQARQKTDSLLREAVAMAMESELPTIIAGDLNHSPSSLATWQTLEAHGWRHTASMYEELYAHPIPCTYLQASTPDMMMFSPHLCHLVQSIEVDQTGWVAGHHPLTVTLQVPQQPPTKTTWRSPKSWLPYEPLPELIEQSYLQAPADPQLLRNAAIGPTQALKEWATQVEQAVDTAIALQHRHHPEHQPYDSLPNAAKGRCQIPKLIQVPQQRSIKKAWRGHYNPELDTGPIKLRQWVRQIRRIQSLRLRLQKLETLQIWQFTWLQLGEEWQAILRGPGFRGGFRSWLATHPELLDPQWGFPTVACLFDMEQILSFETKILEQQVKSHQRALQQFHRWFDKKRNYSKQAFASVQEESFGCLQTAQIKVSTQATFEDNYEMGLLTLQLQDQLVLRPDLPVWLDHQMATIIHYDYPNLEVMLQDVDAPVNNPCILSQHHQTAEPEQVGRALTAFWNRYWQRDHTTEQKDPAPWQSFEEILDTMPDLPPLQLDLTNRTLWRDAIKALKSTTARGVCGFFADELKQVAQIDSILDDFITLCNHLTSFPSWFMISKVHPVAKCYNANAAGQVRPITVLALIYRVWGRATSHSLLQAWTTFFPAAVSGFLPGRAAETILYHWQHKLEALHADATKGSLGGLTLDLVKCYNQLPRYPLRQALLKMRIPEHLVRVWYDSLLHLQRWWILDGHASPCGMSTTGVPEGDSWSVMAMLALNRVFVHMVSQDGVEVNAFADNWGYSADQPELHQQALRSTWTLTDCLRLEIDWTKTWGWGTTPQHLDCLRRAAQQVQPDLQLQIASNARELGYILHYRRVQFRGTQKKRHDQARARLKKLSQRGYDVVTVAHVAQQAALPKAFFGVHLYVPGQHYFDEMRTSIAQALCPSGSPNPHLALAAMSDKVLDPEVYVILLALRAARKYLQQASDEWRESFLNLAAKRPLEAQHITGPARALRHYIQRLGWSITRAGDLLIDPWTTLNLRDADFPLIRTLVERDWAAGISLCLTRKDWRNAPPLDSFSTTRLCRTFTDAERGLVVREQCGGFLIQARKTKFNPDLDELCPLCDMPDTVEHRVLECPALDTVRLTYQDVLAWLKEMDPIHLHLPFAFQSHEQQMTTTMLRVLPGPDLCIRREQQPRPKFYTDGSCLFPAHGIVRWAAFAIVQDLREPEEWTGKDLVELSFTDTTAFGVVAVGLCPGRQSVQRAEVEAILRLLECTLDLDVYTDSQYALNLIQLVQNCHQLADLHMHPNFDQITRLFHALQAGTGQPGIWKVKAHQEPHESMAFADLWHAVGNNFVDHVAKQAVKTLGGPLQTALQRHAEDYLQEQKQLQRHLQLRLAINKERTLLLSQAERPMAQQLSNESAVHTLVTWRIKPPGWQLDKIGRDDRVFFASFWGYRFANLLWQWLALLRWPAEPEHFAGRTPVGITWTELTLNFMLAAQELVPINVSQIQGKPLYEKPGTDSTLTEDQMFLPKMADSLRNCLRQMSMLSTNLVVPDIRSRGVRSLYMLNGEAYVHGFARRPELPYQDETVKLTLAWLRDKESRAYPEIPVRRPLLFPEECPSEFNQMNSFQMYTTLRESKRAMPR